MFWERYTFLCGQIGKSPNAFAKEIGAKTSACTYWKNGTIPNGETLLKIASNFGCSIDYLLGRTDNSNSHKEKSSSSNLTDEELELLDKFRHLLEIDKGRILERMETIYAAYSPEQKENVS